MRDIPTSASHEESIHTPSQQSPSLRFLAQELMGKKPHYEATGPVAHLLATKGVNKGLPRMKSLILALKSPGASGPINV